MPLHSVSHHQLRPEHVCHTVQAHLLQVCKAQQAVFSVRLVCVSVSSWIQQTLITA